MTVPFEIAARLTYRPAWSFAADGQSVVMTFTGPNSHPMSDAGDLTLSVTVDLSPFDNVRDAVLYVRDRIAMVEAHERAEWLRFDGLCVDKEARRAHPGHFEPWPDA